MKTDMKNEETTVQATSLVHGSGPLSEQEGAVRATRESGLVWWATEQARCHTGSWRAYVRLLDRLLELKGCRAGGEVGDK